MRKRRVLSWLLAVVLLLGTGLGGAVYAEEAGEAEAEQAELGEVQAEEPVFSDISNHWAENTIKEAVSLGIVGGHPDGTFLPNTLIKREEFFTLVCNILTEKPDITGTVITFTDVSIEGWYLLTVQRAVAGGMTSGYPDGTFGVGATMSRQEAAQVASTIISQSATDAESAASINDLNDANTIADWSRPAIELMLKKGYMQGDTEGNFRPTTGITRAEAVQLLLNIYKNEPEVRAGGANSSVNPDTDDTDNEDPGNIASAEPERSAGGCVGSHLKRTVTNVDDITDEEFAALPNGHFKVGDGTQSSPYEIYTQEQLHHIREHNAPGTYFKLMASIEVTEDFAVKKPAITAEEADWSPGNWTPIGTKDNPFQGALDGNGYIITGLDVKNNDEGLSAINLKSDAMGLIGYLAKEGSITNIHISKSNFTNKGNYTGAAAGYAEGPVVGCVISGSVEVSGANYTGGIVGYAQNTLSDSSSNGTVKGTGRYVGGVAGQFSSQGSTVSRCHNRGSVRGTDSAGGVVGGITGDASTSAPAIKDSVNYGDVEGGSYYAGGVVGYAYAQNAAFIIRDCENEGDVTSSSVAGGITGFVENSRVTVQYCENTGTVKGHSVGGIAGGSEGTVEFCKNTGTISGSLYVGGIAGFQRSSNAKVLKSYNEGTVGENTSSTVGGIVGDNDAMVHNSYNTGRIIGDSSVGGLAGRNTGRIINCYNEGSVRGSKETGSVSGKNTGTLNNCFWLAGTESAAVSASSSTGTTIRIYSVTEEQLAGDKQLQTNKGSEYVLDAMNEFNDSSSDPIWEYIGSGYTHPVLVDMSY